MDEQNLQSPPETDDDRTNEMLTNMFLKAMECIRIAMREHHRGHSEHGIDDLHIILMQHAALYVLQDISESYLLMSAPGLNLEDIRRQCLDLWNQYRANRNGDDLNKLLAQGQVVMGPPGEA